MSAPIANDKLTAWAREHLVYEAGMLAYATRRLGELMSQPQGPESNMAVECFAVHVRCLDGFLWAKRGDHKFDAFAADFCDEGVWAREGGERPAVLIEMHKRKRLGREIVHLSYHRLDVPAETKEWPVGQITTAILDGLGKLAGLALPERMDDATRARLGTLPVTAVSQSGSVALYLRYHGGTIEFPADAHDEG